MSPTSNASDNGGEQTSEIANWLKVVGLPANRISQYDEKYLRKPLGDSPRREHREIYTLQRLATYKDSTALYEDALVDFQDDFRGWTEEDFRVLNPELTRALRSHLRSRGIYTGRGMNPPASQLASALTMEELPEFPESDLGRTKFHPDTLEFDLSTNTGRAEGVRRFRRERDAAAAAKLEQAQQTFMQPRIGNPTLTSREQTTYAYQPPAETVEVGTGSVPRQWAPTADMNARPVDMRQSMTPYPTLPQSLNPDPYRALPPIQYASVPLGGAKIATFVKIWDKELDYSGNSYDILDDKMLHFYDTCQQAEIQPNQFHAVFSRILKGRARDYFIHYLGNSVDRSITFTFMYTQLKLHFDHSVNHQQYFTDFHTLRFKDVIREKGNEDKTPLECLDLMLDKLQLCQRALGAGFQGDKILCSRLRDAVQSMPEFTNGLFQDTDNFEQLASRLRASLHLAKVQGVAQYHRSDLFFTDRKYKTNAPDRAKAYKENRFRKKKCYVCGKEGCFSTKHSKDEQRRSRDEYIRKVGLNKKHGREAYQKFLVDVEGQDDSFSSSDNGQSDHEDTEPANETHNYFIQNALCNNAFLHVATRENRYAKCTPACPPSQFVLDRYDCTTFQGILPDTGAAGRSTGGIHQFQALRNETPGLRLDTSRAGEAQVRFGAGEVLDSIGACEVNTAIGTIVFHIVNRPTPFLCSLEDMNRCRTYLNNTTNTLVTTLDDGSQAETPVIVKWGHPWFHLGREEDATAFLTEEEIRRVHRRCGHPSADRLFKLLTRAGHEDITMKALEQVNKVCHYCQIKGAPPQRFRFTLRDDVDFNHTIYVDVMFLDGMKVLHVIDLATSFNACRFLKGMSSEETWEAIRACWIDVYLGPPEFIVHDQGTNFSSVEFRGTTRLVDITCVEVPVEAHNAMGKVERAHALIRRAWEILVLETRGTISNEVMLQMAVKTVNDTSGPDGLVPTLLVFGAYPRLTSDSPPTSSTVKRAHALAKAIAAVRQLSDKRKVDDALAARNGPDITALLPSMLPIGSEVRVWREKKSGQRAGWQGPFKVISTDGVNVVVDDNGPRTFRATVVRPYNRFEPDEGISPVTGSTIENGALGGLQSPEVSAPTEAPFQYPPPVEKRRRGRPRKYPTTVATDTTLTAHDNEPALAIPPTDNGTFLIDAFISNKEKHDMALSLRLREKGVIISPGRPFEASQMAELEGLFQQGVLRVCHESEARNSRVFNARFVNDIKGKLDAPYEKSRSVVAGHSDAAKKEILTQSPTKQRASQRLILALAPCLRKHFSFHLWLRDITQAYVQSKSRLQRQVFVRIPRELRESFPEGSIMEVLLPLYGLAESGLHWYATYHTHHLVQLNMEESAFDPCLLFTSPGVDFGITGLQTDDTLNLSSVGFMQREEEELHKAGFRAKARTVLEDGMSGEFNGCRVLVESDRITVTSKGQGDRLAPVDVAALDYTQEYIRQRARGAYLASICQPEAMYGYSVAAQAQKDPKKHDVDKLNHWITWSTTNLTRGLMYIPLDLSKAKLIMFADGSFANNADLSSQIGFIVCLANEEFTDDGGCFDMHANILHFQSIKCKRVTRSSLASEVYGLAQGFDVAFVLRATLRSILQRLSLPDPPLIICTDSRSLYDCLVKLGTTAEKRLMIDILALRQSYEQREIDEIRWIKGNDNPADAMTKAVPNSALETLVSTGRLTVRVDGSVQRGTT